MIKMRLKRMIKGVAITILSAIGTFGLFTMNVGAAENESKEEWKTSITCSPYKLDEMFMDYYEAKTMYTTTGVNMRRYPNTNTKDNIERVLWTNTEVLAIGEYNGWTQIVANGGKDGEEHKYYIWNQYLSEERTLPAKMKKNGGVVKPNEYLGQFKLTAYCKCSKCCGKWAGKPTASGVWPKEGRTVAMNGVPFGTELIINGKVYVIEDRGTPYGHVDIFFDTHAEATKFGKKYEDVYKIN